jgi:hypothetical protein
MVKMALDALGLLFSVDRALQIAKEMEEKGEVG